MCQGRSRQKGCHEVRRREGRTPFIRCCLACEGPVKCVGARKRSETAAGVISVCHENRRARATRQGTSRLLRQAWSACPVTTHQGTQLRNRPRLVRHQMMFWEGFAHARRRCGPNPGWHSAQHPTLKHGDNGHRGAAKAATQLGHACRLRERDAGTQPAPGGRCCPTARSHQPRLLGHRQPRSGVATLQGPRPFGADTRTLVPD